MFNELHVVSNLLSLVWLLRLFLLTGSKGAVPCMIQLPMVSPRTSKKNCNQSGPYPTGSHIEYIAFEPRGYTVKKHGRRWGMRDLNEIGT